VQQVERDGQLASEPAVRLARGLGWFSIGLGALQLLAPGRVNQVIGVRNTGRHRATQRAIGLREVVVGIGLVTRRRPVGFAWTRTAGDVLDLMLLRQAFGSWRNDRGRLAQATAAVAACMALDLRAGQRLRGAKDHPVQIAQSITVNRPIEEVFAFWRDFENLPRFMDNLASVEVLTGGRSRWRAKAPVGVSVEWEAEILDERPPALIAWESLEGSDVSTEGMVSFSPAPGDRGTEVRVEIDYEPPGGAVGEAIAKLFGKVQGHQLESDLRRFKQLMEVGEIVKSDASIHPGPHAARPPEKTEEVRS